MNRGLIKVIDGGEQSFIMEVVFVGFESIGHLNQQEEDDQHSGEAEFTEYLLRKQLPELPHLAALPLLLLLDTLHEVLALSEGVQSVALLLGELYKA